MKNLMKEQDEEGYSHQDKVVIVVISSRGAMNLETKKSIGEFLNSARKSSGKQNLTLWLKRIAIGVIKGSFRL
jgi:hypothetical protein